MLLDKYHCRVRM